MKLSSVFKILLGIVAVLLAAAFIAPILSSFLNYPFPRILSRTVLVLFALWLGFLFFRTRGAGLKQYGLVWESGSLLRFLICFLFAFVVLLIMTMIEIPIGVRAWQVTIHQTVWPMKILKYIFSALLVGVFEEFIFRGLLFGVFMGRSGLNLTYGQDQRGGVTSFRLIFAFVLTNIIYSLVHFLRYSSDVPITNPNFISSLNIYGAMWKAFGDPVNIMPGAIGLFLFGCVLSFAYLRTGNLIASIGLHAGAVFFLKLDRWFVHLETEAQKFWFGGTDLHACVVGWIFLLLMGIGVHFLFPKRDRKRID